MVEAHTARVELQRVVKTGDTSTLLAAEDITHLTKIQTVVKLGKTADSFTLNIFDMEGGEDNYWYSRIESGDLINIYSSTDGGVTETQEINGVVKQKTKRKSPDSMSVTVTGLNRLESLLGLITTVASRIGQRKPADYWIRLILREVNTQNNYAIYTGGVEPSGVTILRPEKYIYGGLLTEWDAVSNDKRTDLNISTEFYRGDQIAFELIESLSSKELSGDNHLYYIDANNYFRWVIYDPTTSGTLPSNYQDAKYDKNEYDLINYLVMSAGKNLYKNATIKSFKYDLLSATENGIKAKAVYLEGTNEIVLNELRLKLKSDGYFTESDFPFSSTYPFTPPATWDDTTAVTTDAELNAAFVTEVVRRIDNYALDYLELKTKPTIKHGFVVPDGENQQTNYVIGGLYTDPFTGKDLRVTTRTKTFTPQDGWITDIIAEEDFNKV